MGDIKIKIHGHIDSAEAFADLVKSLAPFYAYKIHSNGHAEKFENPKTSLITAKNLLIEKNAEDEGFDVRAEFSPHGAIEALMECGRRNAIDMTVERKWGPYGEDGLVNFVRDGKEPFQLPLAGSQVAINEDALEVLAKRGMANLESIKWLFGVLREADNMPRFTVSDDVVMAAVLPQRNTP